MGGAAVQQQGFRPYNRPVPISDSLTPLPLSVSPFPGASFPNGESGADVYDRITIFEDHMIRDINAGRFASSNTALVLVTHGLALRVFLMRWWVMCSDGHKGKSRSGSMAWKTRNQRAAVGLRVEREETVRRQRSTGRVGVVRAKGLRRCNVPGAGEYRTGRGTGGMARERLWCGRQACLLINTVSCRAAAISNGLPWSCAVGQCACKELACCKVLIRLG